MRLVRLTQDAGHRLSQVLFHPEVGIEPASDQWDMGLASCAQHRVVQLRMCDPACLQTCCDPACLQTCIRSANAYQVNGAAQLSVSGCRVACS
jgi:hypothetical protein